MNDQEQYQSVLEEIEREFADLPANLTLTGNDSPVEVTGTIDKVHLYYCARRGKWGCFIAETLGDAVDAAMHPAPNKCIAAWGGTGGDTPAEMGSAIRWTISAYIKGAA